VLTGVRINLQSLQRLPAGISARKRIDESIVVVDEALGLVRELSFELRPSLLDDLGLPAALRWYVKRYAERTGITADVFGNWESDGRLPRELETACFRITQEALTNVARHSQATGVSVHLKRSGEKLRLLIRDNGLGFEVDDLLAHASSVSVLGLRGMAERAHAVEGRIDIDSSPGHGTEVCATFPLTK
jgi:signal transduction histidine kinase